MNCRKRLIASEKDGQATGFINFTFATNQSTSRTMSRKLQPQANCLDFNRVGLLAGGHQLIVLLRQYMLMLLGDEFGDVFDLDDPLSGILRQHISSET